MTPFLLTLLLNTTVYSAELPAPFRFRLFSDPPTLDWNRSYTDATDAIITNVMEGMFSLNNQLKVVPCLIDSWKVSQDGLIYDFHIKNGVLWTDGQALTADDFVFSWQRLLTPETAAQGAVLFEAVLGAKDFSSGKLKDFSRVGIQQVDPKTVRVKLTSRVAGWQGVLTSTTTYPLRRDIVDKFGSKWTQPENIQTLGPYLISKIEPQQRIILKENPRYHGTQMGTQKELKDHLKEAEAIIVENGSTATKLFNKKSLDIAQYLNFYDISDYTNSKELRSFPSLAIQYAGFVFNKPHLINQKFRQAIQMAIDKSLIPKILGGYAAPAESFIPPGILKQKIQKSSFDPEKARKLLKQSKIPQNIKLKLVVGTSGNPHPIAEFIQQQLKTNLGINIEIDQMGLKAAREARAQHTSDLFITGYAPDYADPYSYFSYFLDPNGFTLWKNEKFTKKVSAAQNTTSETERLKMNLEAEKILQNDLPVIPLFYSHYIVLMSDRIESAEISPLGHLILQTVRLK